MAIKYSEPTSYFPKSVRTKVFGAKKTTAKKTTGKGKRKTK